MLATVTATVKRGLFGRGGNFDCRTAKDKPATLATTIDDITTTSVQGNGRGLGGTGWVATTKLAVNVPAPAIVTVVVAAPAFPITIAPLLADQLPKAKPTFGVPVTGRPVSFSHTSDPEGFVVPAPPGFTAKETWYWVV